MSGWEGRGKGGSGRGERIWKEEGGLDLDVCLGARVIVTPLSTVTVAIEFSVLCSVRWVMAYLAIYEQTVVVIVIFSSHFISFLVLYCIILSYSLHYCFFDFFFKIF